MHRLITIGVSHYCEKARWALDRSGVAYVEEAHLPVFHMRSAKRASGGSMVPVLVTSEGETITESAAIVRWADQHAAEPICEGVSEAGLALEKTIDGRFGRAVRTWAYGHLLPEGKRHVEAFGRGAPRWETRAMRLSMPIAKRMMMKGLGITPERTKVARERVVSTLDTIGEHLEKSGEYLDGGRFSVVDLTYAALAGPLVNCGVTTPIIDEARVPAAMREDVAQFSAHPAGQLIERLYRTQRNVVPVSD